MDEKKRRDSQEKLEDIVINTIKKYDLIKNGDKIVIGVSGGPDSMCLLDNLYTISQKLKKQKNIDCKSEQDITKQGFDIVVAHVNHMIRQEALQDEQYVRQYCEKKGIEFYAKSIDVKKVANNNKIGTEEAGRNERYQFFDEIMEKVQANKIAIAHNKNDQAETIIMNLLRGTGIIGLKGIEAKRGKYIRPLIECERLEIEKYCEEKKIEPRIDKTNFDNIYTRNKIRNIVIPYVQKEFNPNIINTLNRLSNIVEEEEDYIENQVEKTYQKLIFDENIKENRIILDLRMFNNQEKVIKSRVVLYTITKLLGHSKGIEKVHIEDIIKLCSNNIGNKYLTPNKNIKILVKNHKIYFINQL